MQKSNTHKTKIFALIFGLLFTILSQNAFAQGVKVSATLDSTVIFIGGQIDLKLELSQPIDAQVSFPTFPNDTIIKDVEIVERGQVDTTKTNNRLVLTQLYRVTSFDSGLHYIPPIEFEVIEAESKSIAKSNALSLMVVNPFKEVNPQNGITPIKEPLKAPFKFSEIYDTLLYILLGLIVVGALIFLYIRYKDKLKGNGKEKEEFVPVEAAHIIALRALDHIKESKLWEHNREKEYYTNISNTLRAYIEHRYHLSAMEQTSDQILSSLKGSTDVDKAILAKLDQVFKLSDLVKFAKFKPLPNENEVSILNSYFFVNHTKVEEIKPPEENEEKASEKPSPSAETKNS